jgi:hypothetical protein
MPMSANRCCARIEVSSPECCMPSRSALALPEASSAPPPRRPHLPAPQGPPEALPYSILRRLSSTSESRAAPGAGALRRGGGVALGAREEPLTLAGGAGGLEGVLPKCRRKMPFHPIHSCLLLHSSPSGRQKLTAPNLWAACQFSGPAPVNLFSTS